MHYSIPEDDVRRALNLPRPVLGDHPVGSEVAWGELELVLTCLFLLLPTPLAVGEHTLSLPRTHRHHHLCAGLHKQTNKQ